MANRSVLLHNRVRIKFERTDYLTAERPQTEASSKQVVDLMNALFA